MFHLFSFDLSYDVASRSKITPCNKIDKPKIPDIQANFHFSLTKQDIPRPCNWDFPDVWKPCYTSKTSMDLIARKSVFSTRSCSNQPVQILAST